MEKNNIIQFPQKDLAIEEVFNKLKAHSSPEELEMLKELGINSGEDFFRKIPSLLKDIDPEVLVKMLENDDSDDDDMSLLPDDFFDDIDDDILEDTITGGDYSSCIPSHLYLGAPDSEYHVRIKLLNSPVKIWRELKVPSNLTLDAFAYILVHAMGWGNSHLHQIEKGNTFYVDDLSYAERNEDSLFFRADIFKASEFKLSDILHEKGERCKMEYDFGDGWEHEIWVKGIREYQPDETPTVSVIKGSGACPPEDCGGVWGYDDLLQILAKRRKTADEKERLEWFDLTRGFDPEAFDLDEI